MDYLEEDELSAIGKAAIRFKRSEKYVYKIIKETGKLVACKTEVTLKDTDLPLRVAYAKEEKGADHHHTCWFDEFMVTIPPLPRTSWFFGETAL